MIILDTNVISADMYPDPPEALVHWLRFVPADELYTTAITEAEMRYGAFRMSLHRARGLEAVIDRIFTVRFAGRVLPFDSAAAKEFPAILIAMQRDLRSHSVTDAQIAAIARAHGASIATHDSGFEQSGVPIIDPWNG
ncbi:MAG: type II toxin-antitoxin system VapC family toxin [Proteobacteria bacterium]|nr:type II toxin-antitoxin system VapC family toxin [Pseudomonadota bacterium]